MSWNIAPECTSMVILGIIWIYSLRGSQLPTLRNRMFQGCIFVTFVAMITNVLSTILLLYYQVVPLWLNWLVMLIYYIFTPLMGMFYFYYAYAVIYEKSRRSLVLLGIFGIPGFLYTILVLLNVFSRTLFDITLRDGYVQGPWRFVTYVIFYLYCVACIFLVLTGRKHLERRFGYILVSFPSIAGLVIVVQLIAPDVILSGSAATAAILIIYLHLQNKQITLDYLTRLPNRQELVNILDYLIHRGNGVNFTVLVISLRRFKHINDTYGHSSGDALLQSFGEYLSTITDYRNLYRFGGDEFAVVLRNPTEQAVKELLYKIQERMLSPWKMKDFVILIPYAIGIAHYPHTSPSVEGIINGAEYAVAKAKQQKEMNVCYCDGTMMDEIKRKNTILSILREKMQDNTFELYYQPIYSVASGKFSFAESLMRINDSSLGSISPAEFIPIAEESGLIVELTYQILEKVCAFVRQLQEAQREIQAVHINFSAIQFTQENLCEKVFAIIEKYGIPYSSIKVEFTESAIADNPQRVSECAKLLTQKGIRLGLDDFGTGYSNIESVIKLPFGSIKIDKSMVRAAVSDSKSAIMLRNMSKTFQELGATVVAEGVENEEEDRFIKDCGIDMIQGFLYARPMPMEEAQQFLKNHEAAKG